VNGSYSYFFLIVPKIKHRDYREWRAVKYCHTITQIKNNNNNKICVLGRILIIINRLCNNYNSYNNDVTRLTRFVPHLVTTIKHCGGLSRRVRHYTMSKLMSAPVHNQLRGINIKISDKHTVALRKKTERSRYESPTKEHIPKRERDKFGRGTLTRKNGRIKRQKRKRNGGENLNTRRNPYDYALTTIPRNQSVTNLVNSHMRHNKIRTSAKKTTKRKGRWEQC